MGAVAKPHSDAIILAALVSGASFDEAADQAQVSNATVRRRLADARFRRELDDAQDLLIGQTVAQMVVATTSAVDTLIDLLRHPSAVIRLGAAKTILEQALRYRSHQKDAHADWQRRQRQAKVFRRPDLVGLSEEEADAESVARELMQRLAPGQP